MTAGMRVQGGGEGEPVLLLVHGLGATGDVWNRWHPLLAERWPGRWLVPDLPGHGGSDALPGYSFGTLAAGLAGLVNGVERLVALGHSLGGVLGLTLASGWFGVHVEFVVGLGIKVAWTADELDKAGALALRPVSWYTSREEAAARYLRVSGLAGLPGVDDDATGAGVREEAGQWRLAMDPSAFAVGAPDMPGLLSAARATVVLARGEHDPMVTDEQLAMPGSTRMTLSGLGHNAHVENPAVTMALLEPYLR